MSVCRWASLALAAVLLAACQPAPTPSPLHTASPYGGSGCSSDPASASTFRNLTVRQTSPGNWRIAGEARLFEAMGAWEVHRGARAVDQSVFSTARGQEWSSFSIDLFADPPACLWLFEPPASGQPPAGHFARLPLLGAAAPLPPPMTVDGTGATLVAPPASVVNPVALNAPCAALSTPGWQLDACGSIPSGRGPLVWLTEKHTDQSGLLVWRASVFTYSDGAGAWVLNLTTSPDPSASFLDGDVTVKTIAFNPAASDQVVFFYRHQGSGQYLDYDVVGRFQGSIPSVLVHREGISHGAAITEKDSLVQYEAVYPNGEPNCCAAYFLKSRLAWDGNAFVLTPLARVVDVPPGGF